MTSLIWDESDARISEDILSEIDNWAEEHSEKCHFMKDIVDGEGFMEYYVAYEGKSNRRLIGGRCPCGCTFQKED